VTYGPVTCERVEPFAPEAYVCAWDDRNKLVMALLHDNKDSRTSRREPIKGAKGVMSREHAYVEVQSCS
jgi:hypothetical protein